MATQYLPIVEQVSVTRDYGFAGIEAIVDHPTHGRVLLCDGYGEDASGAGCVRWRHGMAIRLQPGDTLDGLHADGDAWLRMWYGYDDARPVLEWTGHMVAAVAKSAGLN